MFPNPYFYLFKKVLKNRRESNIKAKMQTQYIHIYESHIKLITIIETRYLGRTSNALKRLQ